MSQTPGGLADTYLRLLRVELDAVITQLRAIGRCTDETGAWQDVGMFAEVFVKVFWVGSGYVQPL